jgi:hypothetical protein
MMAGLTSMVLQGDNADGLYKWDDEEEGELLVAAGPGLDALLGLERSVSNAMVTLVRTLRLVQRGTQHGSRCG